MGVEKVSSVLRETAVSETHYRVALWLLGLYWAADSLASFHHAGKYLDPGGIQLAHTGLLDWVADVTPAAATLLFLGQALIALQFAATQKRVALVAFVALDAFLYLVDIDRGQNHRYLQVLLGAYLVLLWPLGKKSVLSRALGWQLGWVYGAAAVAKMNPEFLRGDILLQTGWLAHTPLALYPESAATGATLLAWSTIAVQLVLAQLMVVPRWLRFRGLALLAFHGLLILSQPAPQIVLFNLMMIAVSALWWPNAWVVYLESLRERVQARLCLVTRPRWGHLLWLLWALLVVLVARRLQDWLGEPSIPWWAGALAVLVPLGVAVQRGIVIKPWAQVAAFCLCAAWILTPTGQLSLRYPVVKRAVLNLGEAPEPWEARVVDLDSAQVARLFAVRRFLDAKDAPDALRFLSAVWSDTASESRAGDVLWRSVDLQLAQGLIDQKHYHRAREVLLQLLAYEPLWWEAHHELGIALWELEDLDGADLAYRRAVRLGSYPEASVSQYVRLLMEQSKKREAQELLQTARRLRPELASSWDVLAGHWGL